MGRRGQFRNEFKLEAVKLTEQGLPVAQVAREVGVCESVLRRWVSHFGYPRCPGIAPLQPPALATRSVARRPLG